MSLTCSFYIHLFQTLSQMITAKHDVASTDEVCCQPQLTSSDSQTLKERIEQGMARLLSRAGKKQWGWRLSGSLIAGCFRPVCRLFLLLFSEELGPLHQIQHLHPLPFPLSTSPQGKQNLRVFGFGLLGDLVLHDLKLLSEQWVSNGYSAKSLLGTVSVKREGMRGGGSNQRRN